VCEKFFSAGNIHLIIRMEADEETCRVLNESESIHVTTVPPGVLFIVAGGRQYVNMFKIIMEYARSMYSLFSGEGGRES